MCISLEKSGLATACEQKKNPTEVLVTPRCTQARVTLLTVAPEPLLNQGAAGPSSSGCKARQALQQPSYLK